MSAWRMAARIAGRELRGGLSGFRILIACLALGVAAIAGVGTVRSAIEAGLSSEGAALLGGDAEISLTYRFATPEERQWIDAHSLSNSEIAEFRSMAQSAGGQDRALTQVKAVDGNYPLVGQVRLTPSMPLSQALAGAGGLPGTVMAPTLISRLGLKIGDRVTLGGVPFRLMATLANEPDANASGFSLGPRSMVLRSALAHTALLKPGTLFDSHYRLELAPGTNLSDLQKQAQTTFADSGIRWRDARDGAPGISDFVTRLSAFLTLVGLAGLAVGGVGVSAAVRTYLGRKTPVIATLRTLGATRAVIFWCYFLQIGVLALAGIVIGLVLGAGVPLLLAPLLTALLPIPAAFGIYPGALGLAALYGVLTALIFTLWPLARSETIRAAALLRDTGAEGPALPPARMLALIAGLVGLLIGLAALFSGQPRLTLWAAAGVLGALIVLSLAAMGLRRLAGILHRPLRGRPALRWAMAAIAAPGNEALPVVLSLGLGLSVLASVGQIDGNMRLAISRDLPGRAPSDYVVDIQQDQIEGFLSRVKGTEGVSRVDSAPMLRGVITRINGKPAKEVAGDSWVLKGDRGVSYADAPPPGTKITEGQWWPRDYKGDPQISFAADQAKDLGLKLGDTMTLNILGRDITGTVTSFRAVDFRNAGMGFILVMDAHALAAAPHSWIATIYASQAAEGPLLRELGRSYPTITAISVRDAIARVSALLATIASATSWGAAATLLTGFLVLIGAAMSGERQRVHEAAVLKVLGASRARILLSLALRSGLLGAGAGVVALAAGVAGGWAVCHFVFETSYAVIWSNALAVILGGLAINLAAGLALAWRPLSARPAGVLRSRD